MSATLPEPIERMRMALSEIGHGDSVRALPMEADGRVAYLTIGLSVEVAWRAREVALVNEPRCLACHIRSDRRPPPGVYPCIATRRFEQDCGVSR